MEEAESQDPPDNNQYSNVHIVILNLKKIQILFYMSKKNIELNFRNSRQGQNYPKKNKKERNFLLEGIDEWTVDYVI